MIVTGGVRWGRFGEGLAVSSRSVARDLEISRNLLYRWKRQVEAEPTDAFPGHGRMKPEQEELQRLRRELATVREERDFLKKTIAFFAKESE
jgi:transposase